MDEVEHRRRRTRSTRAGDDAATRTGGTPPAHTAERTAADPTGTGPAEAARAEPPASRTPESRPARTRDRDGHHGERALPFDAHSAHPINEERDGERGLRGLVGSGATQVSVSAAMRARDAARPSDADLAHAEATLTIVHRGWVPRDPA
jgi:hypothetical protein